MNRERARYFLWALSHLSNRDLACPFCRNSRTRLIKRKALVTSLRECDECCLRFRVPKDDAESAIQFYQTRYQQGFATDYPTDIEVGCS